MIILTHGWTASGKSSTARRLLQAMPQLRGLHSAVVRHELNLVPGQVGAPQYEFRLNDPVFVEQVSRVVYTEMRDRAAVLLEKGTGVLLDATYNFFWQRTPIYELAARFATALTVVHCVCPEAEIVRRLKARAAGPTSPFSEVNAWETYLSTKELSEPIEQDVLPDGQRPHILCYDTHSAAILSRPTGNCPHCQVISDILESSK